MPSSHRMRLYFRISFIRACVSQPPTLFVGTSSSRYLKKPPCAEILRLLLRRRNPTLLSLNRGFISFNKTPVKSCTLYLLKGKRRRIMSSSPPRESSSSAPAASGSADTTPATDVPVKREEAPYVKLDLNSEQRKELLNRMKGLTIGGALGDTIGLYTEFLRKEACEKAYPKRIFSLVKPVTPFCEDSHRNRFDPRAWTDDTDQTLCILLTYLYHNGELPVSDFAARLRKWCEQGLRCLDRLPLGIGKTVGRTVFDKGFLENPTATAERIWRKTGCGNAANGSLMRTSIIASMYVDAPLTEAFDRAIDMGGVTHADFRCHVSCCAAVGVLRGILRKEITTVKQVDEMVEVAWNYCLNDKGWYKEPECVDRQEWEKYVYFNDPKGIDGMVLDAASMGYVYICLGSSLWCLRSAMEGKEDFRSAIVRLIMGGGDADTNAAVAGAFLGALCGYEALPSEWRDGLKHRDWLLEKINAMCIINGIQTEGAYDGKQDPDAAFDGGKGFLTEEQMKKREMEIVERILKKKRGSWTDFLKKMNIS